MKNRKNYETYSCEDESCDLNPQKICDNCGKCLEKEGIDTRAIKISEISKTVEENEKVLKDLEDNLSDEEKKAKILEEYSKLDDGTYEDAFDHIEYIEEIDDLDDDKFDEMTEEIFPGVRRFRRKD